MKNPSDFKCPTCKAPQGFPCRNRRGGWMPQPHGRRIHLAAPNPIRHSTLAGVIGDKTKP